MNSSKRLHSIFVMLVLLSLTLGACHFPQDHPTKLSASAQRQTEIASILYPKELTPGSEEPTPKIQQPAPQPTRFVLSEEEITYTTQQGDTLPVLALRFEVPAGEIQSDVALSPSGLLPIGAPIKTPNNLEDMLPYHRVILPDSELIYGPSVGDFNAVDFAREAGGFLAAYSEIVNGQRLSGPEIVHWVALETSTNPRLLLAFLEYRSGWVFGSPLGASTNAYPIGFGADDKWLRNELMITAKLLAQGFYGWRDGSFTELKFYGGTQAQPSPGLNAGSVGLMQLFASLYEKDEWTKQLIDPAEFLVFYQDMFGNYWDRAALVEPYLLATTPTPELSLPFAIGEVWRLTGGPHLAWQTGTPFGALDFAAVTGEPQCAVSTKWATAAAPGLVVRSDRSVVALDLDGDGDEGTGWVLIYMHMSEGSRASLNTWLERDDPVGHPSCEGGTATGTHLHFTWKFNGEWVGVEEPLPLILSGWRVIAGERRYEGLLIKEDQIVTSRPNETSTSIIIRTD